MSEWKSETSHARWLPIDVCIGEMATCLDQLDRPSPIVRKIEKNRFVHGQNSGEAVPIPMLTIGQFQAADGFVFADFEAAVEIEKRFGFRNHAIIMTRSPTDRQCTPLWLSARHAADKLAGIDAVSLIKTTGDAGSPPRSPFRNQAHPLVVVRGGERKHILVKSKPHLLFSLAAEGVNARARIGIG